MRFSRHSRLIVQHALLSLFSTPYSLFPVFLCLLLTGCSDFERAAYRTLAVTQAEYETMQRHAAEAAAHGLITEDQWNRFAAEGHRFIDAHNAAVDAFELWSRAKNPANEARLQALLEILPRLVRELNSLAESFERRETEGRSQESESEETPNPKVQNPSELQTPCSKPLSAGTLDLMSMAFYGAWLIHQNYKPEGLKPLFFPARAARLKPCPDGRLLRSSTRSSVGT